MAYTHVMEMMEQGGIDRQRCKTTKHGAIYPLSKQKKKIIIRSKQFYAIQIMGKDT